MSFAESERVNPNGFTGREGFDPSQHPRATDGTFTEKTGGAPEVSLTPNFPVAEQTTRALRGDAAPTLDAISVNDTTAADRFLGASDAAWSRYRSEQEELRQMLPEALAERTRLYFPDATGLTFETDTLGDGRTVIGYRLISVNEGDSRTDFGSVPFISGEYKHLQAIERDLDSYGQQCVEVESDWQDVATVYSNSGPNTRWEVKF